MAAQGEFGYLQNFPKVETDMMLEVYKAMHLVNNTEHENPINKKALKMLKKFFKDPYFKTCANRVLINKEGLGIAPIHFAATMQNVSLLELFKNNKNIDVNVNFVKNGEQQGNVLDLVTWSETIFNLEVFKSVLQLENIKISELDEDHANIPSVLEQAVKNGREELVFLLLSMDKTFPKFHPYMAALSCLANNRIKLFTKLLPKISQNWTPPGIKMCPFCKVSPNVSLLHFSICQRQPKFLGVLLQSGWEASSVRPSTGLTPLQDAVARIWHRSGPVVGWCSSSDLCLEVLRELVAAPGLDLTVCVEEGGRKRLALEAALEGSMCEPARKFLQQQLKKINLRKKLEKRRKNIKEDTEGSSSLKETCWNCSESSDVRKLSQCANCRAAWYCGEVCQRGDWEEHWLWCQEKQEQRREKKEQKWKDEEGDKCHPFVSDSLAFALD